MLLQSDKDEKLAALEALVEALIPQRNRDVRSVVVRVAAKGGWLCHMLACQRLTAQHAWSQC